MGLLFTSSELEILEKDLNNIFIINNELEFSEETIFDVEAEHSL